jgi:hypothetical protein
VRLARVMDGDHSGTMQAKLGTAVAVL